MKNKGTLGLLRFDATQELTVAEQDQARQNIGLDQRLLVGDSTKINNDSIATIEAIRTHSETGEGSRYAVLGTVIANPADHNKMDIRGARFDFEYPETATYDNMKGIGVSGYAFFRGRGTSQAVYGGSFQTFLEGPGNIDAARGGIFNVCVREDSSGTIETAKGGSAQIANYQNSGTGIKKGHGVFAVAENVGNGRIETALGVEGDVANRNQGNIDLAIGLRGNIRNTSDGNIDTGFALYASASGEIENLYKLYIDDVGAGKSNNYAIYSESRAPSYMAGKLGVGTDVPASSLHVTKREQGAVLTLEREGYSQLNIGFDDRDVVHDLGPGSGLVWNLGGAPKLQLSSSGQLSVGGDEAHDGTSALNLIDGIAPTHPLSGGVSLFSEERADFSHLRVMDGQGHVTTLTSNNFNRIPGGKSEDMAWAYHAEKNDTFVNVDMMKAMRVLEHISGHKLVNMSHRDGTIIANEKKGIPYTATGGIFNVRTLEGSEALVTAKGGSAQIANYQNSGTGIKNGHGLFAVAENVGQGRIETALGVEGDVVNRNQGNIDLAIGLRGNIRNTSGGNIDTGFALYASASGEVENLYKLYIDDVGAGKSNNYAIYSESRAPSYMAGKLGVGTDVPASSLHVTKREQGAVLTLEREGYSQLNIGFDDRDVVHDLGPGSGLVWNLGGAPKLQLSSSGQLSVGGDETHDGTSALNVIDGIAPSHPLSGGVSLFSEQGDGTSHLRVMDGAGNVTTLTPNNFTRIPGGKSEEMAWSYHAENRGKFISVDMMKAMRVLEHVSGKKLVHMFKRDGTVFESEWKKSNYTFSMLMILTVVGAMLSAAGIVFQNSFSSLTGMIGAACFFASALPAATLAQRSASRASQALFSLISPAVILAGLLVFQKLL